MILKKALGVLLTFINDVYRVYLSKIIIDFLAVIFSYVLVQTLVVLLVLHEFNYSKSMTTQVTEIIVGKEGVDYLRTTFFKKYILEGSKKRIN